MKLNVWIMAALAPLTAVMVLAQDAAPAQASLETTPAAPTKKASPVKKKVVLDPPMTATVKSANVNVRGRASFTGETVGHLQKGDTVTVLEQITLSRTTPDEPAEWAQIAVPPGIPVWVNADYIDAEAKTIKARRINLRGGPGENYSVLGRLEKGAAIKEIKKEKGWVAIEAPTNAYAFVAAEFVEMQPAPAVVVTPPAPAPTPTPEAGVAPAPAPAPVPVPAPEPPAATAPAPAPPVAATPAPAPASSQSDADRELEATRRATGEQGAQRIVTREGFVRRAYNIQAPTDFELHDIQNGTLIDYLQPKKGQNFKIFVGTHITVTGPEAMDSRWPRTPVLQVQSADLIP